MPRGVKGRGAASGTGGVAPTPSTHPRWGANGMSTPSLSILSVLARLRSNKLSLFAVSSNACASARPPRKELALVVAVVVVIFDAADLFNFFFCPGSASASASASAAFSAISNRCDSSLKVDAMDASCARLPSNT